MKLRTVLRDCLYVNWSLPLEQLPPAPAPLRYQLFDRPDGGRCVLASAVLFRQQGLRLAGLGLPRFSYPQANVRLYVLDDDNIPGILLRAMMVPAWVLPAAWIGGQPMTAARLGFPRVGASERDDTWSWRVEDGGALEVKARRGAPAQHTGPRFANWEAAVHFFRHRTRGYVKAGRGLRRMDAIHPEVAAAPVLAEVSETSLLTRLLGVEPWPEPHSAFLCGEIPFAFELLPEAARAALAPAAVPKVAADPAMVTQRCATPRAA